MDLHEISVQLQAGKAKLVKELVQQAIDQGIPAKDILEQGLLHGMGISTGIDLDKLVVAGERISEFLGRRNGSSVARALINKRQS